MCFKIKCRSHSKKNFEPLIWTQNSSVQKLLHPEFWGIYCGKNILNFAQNADINKIYSPNKNKKDKKKIQLILKKN